MLEELIVNASIGTGRKAPMFPAMNPAIDDALSALADELPEAKLLGAVSILTRYENCGRLPKSISMTPEPAEEELIAVCPRRAGELLGQILLIPNNENKTCLIGEWLDHAARAERRAPYRLLPALLDYAASRKIARQAIAKVAGMRGQWLMRVNPRWNFDVVGGEDAAALWTTGTRDQRVAVLQRLRKNNAAAARELILSTWKDDAAEDRSMFVAAMIESLGEEDEPFLESCLDDRSKQVRAAAAELLARSPRSAYLRRMIERAESLLNFAAPKKGGLLKKSAPAIVEIVLPPETFVAEWARDGIVEKPEGMGRRQWWFQQILAAVPPIHWSTMWNITPTECIAAVDGEFADVLMAAWHQAANRHPDPQWIAALLAAAKNGRGPMTFSLLNKLPLHAREAITPELFESARMSTENLLAMLRGMDISLDRHSALALFVSIERHLVQQAAGFTYIVTPILQNAALHVVPVLYDELAARSAGDKWEPVRKAVDEFLRILLIRRDIQREFNP